MPKWRQTTAQQPTIGVMLKSVVTRIIAGTNVTISSTGPSGTGDVTINASGSGGGGVTAVTASAPLASSGGTTPNISLTGIVPIADGGTGTATPSLVAGSNITVTGSFPNQTIAASGGGYVGSVYDTLVLADSPLAYFKMNETSGTAVIDTQGGASGVYINAPALGVFALRADGEPCPFFSAASNQYATVPNPITTPGLFSFELLFQMSIQDNVSANPGIIDTGYNAGNGGYIYRAGTVTAPLLNFGYNPFGGSSTNTNTQGPFTLGTVHHLVVTYNGVTPFPYYFWVDGMGPYSMGNSNTGTGIHATVFLAALDAGGGTPTDYADISIGKVAFYNKVLSPARIMAHYGAQRI